MIILFFTITQISTTTIFTTDIIWCKLPRAITTQLYNRPNIDNASVLFAVAIADDDLNMRAVNLSSLTGSSTSLYFVSQGACSTSYNSFKWDLLVGSKRALSNCNNDGSFNPNMAKPDINTYQKLYLTAPLRCSGIFSNSFLTFFNRPFAPNVFLNFNWLWSVLYGNFFGIRFFRYESYFVKLLILPYFLYKRELLTF